MPSPRKKKGSEGREEEEENSYRNVSVSAPSLPISGSGSVSGSTSVIAAQAMNQAKPLPTSPAASVCTAEREPLAVAEPRLTADYEGVA